MARQEDPMIEHARGSDLPEHQSGRHRDRAILDQVVRPRLHGRPDSRLALCQAPARDGAALARRQRAPDPRARPTTCCCGSPSPSSPADGSGKSCSTIPATTSPIPPRSSRSGKAACRFHGALIASGIAILLFAQHYKVSAARSWTSCCAARRSALFFGRVANFINSEHWGRETDAAIGMVFPNGGPLPRHPSQLYEAALEGLVMFIILRFVTHTMLA